MRNLHFRCGATPVSPVDTVVQGGGRLRRRFDGIRTAAAVCAVFACANAAPAADIANLEGQSITASTLDAYIGKTIQNGTITVTEQEWAPAAGTYTIGNGAVLERTGESDFNANVNFNIVDGGILRIKKNGTERAPFFMSFLGGNCSLTMDNGTFISEDAGEYMNAQTVNFCFPWWNNSKTKGKDMSATVVIRNGSTLSLPDGRLQLGGARSEGNNKYRPKTAKVDFTVTGSTISTPNSMISLGVDTSGWATDMDNSYVKANFLQGADVTCTQIYAYRYPAPSVVFDGATIHWCEGKYSSSFIGQNNQVPGDIYTINTGGLTVDIPSGKSLVTDQNASALTGEGGVTKIGAGSIEWNQITTKSTAKKMAFTGPLVVSNGLWKSSLGYAACAFRAEGGDLTLSGALSASGVELAAIDGGTLTLSGATLTDTTPLLTLASGGTTDYFTRDETHAAYTLSTLALGPGAILDLDGGFVPDSITATAVPLSAVSEDPVSIRISNLLEVSAGRHNIITISGSSTFAPGDAAKFTLGSSAPEGTTLTISEDAKSLVLYIPAEEGDKTIEIVNKYSGDTIQAANVTTITGAGGVKLQYLSIPENCTLKLDPIATPLAIAGVPAFGGGSKIALSSAYSGMSLGRIALMTYTGAAAFDQSLFDASSIAPGAAYTLTEETAPDGASTQLVLTVGDYANAAKEIRLAFIGDSITEGVTRDSQGDFPQYRTSIAARLAAMGYNPKTTGVWRKNPLDAAGVAQPLDWTWHFGVSGDAVRTSGAGETPHAGVRDNLHLYLDAAGYVDVITILLGTNDLGVLGDQADPAFVNYTNLVAQICAQRPDAKIIGSTLADRNGAASATHAKVVSFNAQLNAAYAAGKLPANYTLIDIYNDVPLEKAGETEGETVATGNFFSDQVHMNWKGCAATAAVFAGKIAEVLPFASFAGAGDDTITDEAQTALGAAQTVPAEYRDGMTHMFTIEGKAADANLAASDPYTAKPGAASIVMGREVVKVGYYMELVRAGTNRRRFVWVDCVPPAGKTLDEVDFPWEGANIQFIAQKMHVYSNDPGIHNVAASDDSVTGIIEGTHYDYSGVSGLSGAPGDILGNSSTAVFGWNDTLKSTGDYGCFQAHRIFSQSGTDVHWNNAETLFAWNRWGRTGGQEIGIGPYACHASGSAAVNSMDYTLIVDRSGDTGLKEKTAAEAYQIRRLEIWVEPVAARHGVWTGFAGDSKMSTPGNWEDGIVPGAGDALDFSEATDGAAITADIDGNPVFDAVTLGGVVTFTGEISATSYSDTSLIRVADYSTVTLNGNLLFTGTGNKIIVKYIGAGARFVITGRVGAATGSGNTCDVYPQDKPAGAGMVVAGGIASEGASEEYRFRLARNADKTPTTQYWAIGPAGIDGANGGCWVFDLKNNEAHIQPWKSDFIINSPIGVGVNAAGLFINTDDLSGTARTITVKRPIKHTGKVYVSGGGKLVLDGFDARETIHNSSLGSSVSYTVQSGATLGLIPGVNTGTGKITVESGAALEVSCSDTATLGGALETAAGATLAFNFTMQGVAPVLDATGKTVTVKGSLAVKVSIGQGTRLAPGKYKLTEGAKFAGASVSLAPGCDKHVSGAEVIDGDIWISIIGGLAITIK